MRELTDAEKDFMRKAAFAALKQLWMGVTLSAEESSAITRYFDSSWVHEEFEKFGEAEIEVLKKHFQPGELSWLDRLR